MCVCVVIALGEKHIAFKFNFSQSMMDEQELFHKAAQLSKSTVSTPHILSLSARDEDKTRFICM